MFGFSAKVEFNSDMFTAINNPAEELEKKGGGIA